MEISILIIIILFIIYKKKPEWFKLIKKIWRPK